MSTQGLIERVKVKLGVESDYAMAQKLDIQSGRISDYRHGKRVPDVYAISKFAKVLEVDPWRLVEEIEAQTEKNPKRKAYWERKIGAMTTAFFLVVIFNMSPTTAEARPASQVIDNTVYYVKLYENYSNGCCNLLRWVS